MHNTYIYIYICIHTLYLYIYIYIYIYMYTHICTYTSLSLSIHIYTHRCIDKSLLEDSRLFGSSPWKILRHCLWTNGFLSNSAPGENLLSGDLVMETGCNDNNHNTKNNSNSNSNSNDNDNDDNSNNENLTPLPMNKWISEQPSPWRTSSKRKSCYGDRA